MVFHVRFHEKPTAHYEMHKYFTFNKSKFKKKPYMLVRSN